MAPRGFLATLQHQAKVAAREHAKAKRAAQREAERERKAAIREAERAYKAEKKAAAQLERANAAERKRLEKEAREAHIAARQAEVERKNLELTQVYDEIDSLLAATLEVDDYVDLDTLRTVAEHPPFDRTDLEQPTPPPDPIPDPQEPTFVPPPPPKGLRALFGKKAHTKAVKEAKAAHERAIEKWRADLVQADVDRKAAATRHADMEAQRISELEVERARYATERAAREAEAAEQNKAVDTLIANLGYGAIEAVQEYISIVLSNSVYPAHFPVEHEFEFDSTTAELWLRVLVPSPDRLPSVNVYKYKKSSDEITSTSLSQKARRDRYAGAVNQVALRSMHEVFEADRRGIIRTIALEVGTKAIDPATGQDGYILFVAVGAERDSYLELDLSNVLPPATLGHLGASVSKKPFDLVAADASGIRRS